VYNISDPYLLVCNSDPELHGSETEIYVHIRSWITWVHQNLKSMYTSDPELHGYIRTWKTCVHQILNNMWTYKTLNTCVHHILHFMCIVYIKTWNSCMCTSDPEIHARVHQNLKFIHVYVRSWYSCMWTKDPEIQACVHQNLKVMHVYIRSCITCNSDSYLLV
jgi:hypothetical protein